jgi:hypothetical protein
MGIEVSGISESNARMCIRRMPTPEAPAPAAAAAAPALRLQRRVMALLEAHFDDTAGAYRNGYSDARVAEETEAAVTAVERIRADAFGALAEDPRIAALREELELLSMVYEEERTRITGELKRLDATIEEQRAILAGRLDDLARARKLAG